MSGAENPALCFAVLAIDVALFAVLVRRFLR